MVIIRFYFFLIQGVAVKQLISVSLLVLISCTSSVCAKMTELAGLDIYRQEMAWIQDNQPEFKATNAQASKNFYRKHLKEKAAQSKAMEAGRSATFAPFYSRIEELLDGSATFYEFKQKLKKEIERLSGKSIR